MTVKAMEPAVETRLAHTCLSTINSPWSIRVKIDLLLS